MKYRRYDAKRDRAEPAIVDALERAGWEVFRELPTDLLVYKPSKGWRVLETKTRRKADGSPVLDTRQKKQAGFCVRTNTPYVTTPEEALRALGDVL